MCSSDLMEDSNPGLCSRDPAHMACALPGEPPGGGTPPPLPSFSSLVNNWCGIDAVFTGVFNEAQRLKGGEGWGGEVRGVAL